jgi:ElaB/YqjD/DUF883 family membrane-anchored ribosome-binding protein
MNNRRLNMPDETTFKPASSETQENESTSAIGNPGGGIQSAMDASRSKLASAYTAVQERSSRVVHDYEEHIHRSPFTAVAYAAAIGAVIGFAAGMAIGERSGGSWHRRWW